MREADSPASNEVILQAESWVRDWARDRSAANLGGWRGCGGTERRAVGTAGRPSPASGVGGRLAGGSGAASTPRESRHDSML